MMKTIYITITFLILLISGCTPAYIDSNDDVIDKHEKEIKEKYIEFGYTEDEVKELGIYYVGEVNNYLIYKTDDVEVDYLIDLNVSEMVPPWINKTYYVFDKQNKLHYPLEALLNDPRLADYINEVEDLINQNQVDISKDYDDHYINYEDIGTEDIRVKEMLDKIIKFNENYNSETENTIELIKMIEIPISM